jgi:hypothetical protein
VPEDRREKSDRKPQIWKHMNALGLRKWLHRILNTLIERNGV